MKKSNLLIAALASVTLVSCGSLQLVSFEQLAAADVNFPTSVRNVAVVNNMPVVEVGNSNKTISRQLEGDGNVAAETFAKEIANANYFDKVVICDSALRANGRDVEADALLTSEEVQNLADDLGVDLIFSFDQVHIEAKPGVAFLPDYPLPVDAIETVVTPIVSAYIPSKEGPLMVVSKKDTISWEVNPLLSDKQIVKDASEYAAYMPIDYLVPHWTEVTRMYYDGGNVEMRDAGVCVREDDWEGAYQLWSNAYEKKKKGGLKMKAAFNIALYYEMKDDMESAKEWIEKARKLAKPGSTDEYRINLYSAALTERAVSLPKLKIQMNRFEDNF